jgi:hypothetical protein
MKSEQLVSDQVIAWCEGLGDRRLPVQVLKDEVRSPVCTAEGWGRHALFVDLLRVLAVIHVIDYTLEDIP